MLAILSTHPIQYQVPLWQALAKDGNVPFEVWFLSDHATRESFDSGFRQTFAWDLDMLSGYPSRFLETNNNTDVARFSKLRLAEPLGNLLRGRNVKALWIQGWQVAAYWQAAWQAQSVGVPVWIRAESNDLSPVPLWKKHVKQVALGQLFSKISDFLYIGNANRRLYEQFGVKPQQLHPAYYCVDNERFKKQADELRPQRMQIRRDWGIPEDSFCILFAGKFITKKRPMDLIQACANLQKNNPGKRIHLLFAGSGELGRELRQACTVIFDAGSNGLGTTSSNLDGIGPDASFTGFLNQTEISRAYVAADCLALPSNHEETWGLVVNEALASGLPCIASIACGCTEDLIAPINPAFTFVPGDFRALEAALFAIIASPPASFILREQLAKFDFSSSVETVNLLYKGSCLN